MTEHAAARRRRGRILGLFRHHRSGLFALAVLVGAGAEPRKDDAGAERRQPWSQGRQRVAG